MDTGSHVRAILAKALMLDPLLVRDEALLVEDLGFSSLDRFELLMELEESLGLEIQEGDLAEAKTVADVIRCIDQLKGTTGNIMV